MNGITALKTAEMGILARQREAHILCMSELGEWCDIPAVPKGYVLVDHERTGRQTAIYALSGLQCSIFALDIPPDLDSDISVTAVTVDDPSLSSPLIVIHPYVPPHTTAKQRRLFFNVILSQLQGYDLIICGDLNDGSKTFSAINKHTKSPIEPIMKNFNLLVLNDDSITFPRSQSTLDVALVTQSVEGAWSVINDLSSDHHVCEIEVTSHLISLSS